MSPNQEPLFSPPAATTLRVGMHVRIPHEPERTDSNFREYFLGRIEEIDTLADTIKVHLWHKQVDGDIKQEIIECQRQYVRRCHILPDSKVASVSLDAGGIVLMACEFEWVPGQFCDYYVQMDGQTLRLSESTLIAASHRGAPDPRHQMASYELQNPTWQQPRNALIESYSELRTATFGIEDLVGSRIMLLAHQAEVVATVLSDAECRYILADEVGLGKTIEAAVILKGLRRRHPKLRTLIVAPASLVAQWYFEIDHKFWMRFDQMRSGTDFTAYRESHGLIASHEQLTDEPGFADWVKKQAWDLLIVDEAHHVPQRKSLNIIVRTLSLNTPRVLLLSATPIQRHATEFYALLKLLNPQRYAGTFSRKQFEEMLKAQNELVRIVARIVPDLTPEFFDVDDFCEEMEIVQSLLQHDDQLEGFIAQIQEKREPPTQVLQAAQDAIAYISENYRLERRVIRNRRANLQIELPTRAVDEQYSYTPTRDEAATLDELHDYADRLLLLNDHSAPALEIVRLLFNAAFSSPQALMNLLDIRREALEVDAGHGDAELLEHLTVSVSPRSEPTRIQRLLTLLPQGPEEHEILGRVIYHLQQWQEETIHALDALPYRRAIPSGAHRFVQILHALDAHFRTQPQAKVVIFTHWPASLELLQPYVRKHVGKEAIFAFHIDLVEEELQDQVVGFQEATGQAVLLCDELGGEGRNFQMATLLIHLDLPWAPAKLEQRIGRVDRLGRQGEVLSIVPYASDQIEQDLYQIWQHAFELFTRSMSGMEIVLEGIQNELMASLRQGTRDGLTRLIPKMKARSRALREQVEEERYYEERAINRQRRDEFARISARYAAGTVLRDPLLNWASQAGLTNSYHYETDTAFYFPRKFSHASMQNAKFYEVPNMEEAAARSRRASNLRIEGTFNRSVAVVREDLVFFAPGSDPWTDAIIRNAIEADRGRCCAIQRDTPDIEENTILFDFAYRIQVDPRPLLALGHDPIHLLRAQGYLYAPMHRLILNFKGQHVASSDPVAQLIRDPFRRGRDIHQGQRGGQKPPIDWFKRHFPEEKWHPYLKRLFSRAERVLRDEFVFTNDLADEAQKTFDQAHRGLSASADWYIAQNLIPDAKAHRKSIELYSQISQALVAGLRQPLFTLESICCWILRPIGK